MKRQKGTYADIVTVASVNFHTILADKETNLKRIEACIDRAVAKGAGFIVFPEVALTGYSFPVKMGASLAEKIPGPATEKVAEIAAKYKVHIIFGMVEQGDDDLIYNSAVFVAPEGLLGAYRKVHIPVIEPWASGGSDYPIFETKYGPIAIGICWEEYCFPEVPRIYALKGARLLVNITATPDFGNIKDTQESTLGQLKARVHENGYFIVSADLVGLDGETSFVGHSVILGPSPGLMLPQIYAGPASGTDEEIITATIDLSNVDKKPPGLAHVFDHRQPHTYLPLINPDLRRA